MTDDLTDLTLHASRRCVTCHGSGAITDPDGLIRCFTEGVETLPERIPCPDCHGSGQETIGLPLTSLLRMVAAARRVA